MDLMAVIIRLELRLKIQVSLMLDLHQLEKLPSHT